MKQLLNFSKTTKNYVTLAALLLFQGVLMAQETKDVDVDLNVSEGTETDWYGQPWLWVVGGAIFIIIIVALMRGGGKD